MKNGAWKMENGPRKMENGAGKMENGEGKMENGAGKMENGQHGKIKCADFASYVTATITWPVLQNDTDMQNANYNTQHFNPSHVVVHSACYTIAQEGYVLFLQ